MSCSFFEELMSEPPGGHNHGRKRGLGGGHIPLSEDVAQAYADHLTIEPEQRPYRRPTPPPDTVRHGLSAYRKGHCKCEICRAANREHMRRLRNNARNQT